MLTLAPCLACFHLGNGATLPLYGMAVMGAGKGDPAMFTATTVLLAQAVMIAASLVAMRMARQGGYWLVLLVSFLAFPLRGYLAGSPIEYWGVWPVHALDGIRAGLQSVAVPGLVACLLDGTARFNRRQGAVMTVQGVGASLSLRSADGSPRCWDIARPSSSLASVALWIGFAALLRPPARGFTNRPPPIRIAALDGRNRCDLGDIGSCHGRRDCPADAMARMDMGRWGRIPAARLRARGQRRELRTADLEPRESRSLWRAHAAVGSVAIILCADLAWRHHDNLRDAGSCQAQAAWRSLRFARRERSVVARRLGGAGWDRADRFVLLT